MAINQKKLRWTRISIWRQFSVWGPARGNGIVLRSTSGGSTARACFFRWRHHAWWRMLQLAGCMCLLPSVTSCCPGTPGLPLWKNLGTGSPHRVTLNTTVTSSVWDPPLAVFDMRAGSSIRECTYPDGQRSNPVTSCPLTHWMGSRWCVLWDSSCLLRWLAASLMAGDGSALMTRCPQEPSSAGTDQKGNPCLWPNIGRLECRWQGTTTHCKEKAIFATIDLNNLTECKFS